MIIASASADDRIRLIAIEMKGAFGNEGALPLYPSIWKPGNQEEDGGLAMALKISWLPGFQIRSPGSCKAAVIAALRSQLSLARYVLRYFIPVSHIPEDVIPARGPETRASRQPFLQSH